MRSANPLFHVLLACITLVLALLVFELSDLDMVIQHWLFDVNTLQWVWDRHEPVSRFLIYDGIKVLLGMFAVGVLVTLVRAYRAGKSRDRRRALAAVLLTMAVTPSIVGLLKANTNVACPVSLQAFGGDLPHIGLFDAWPEGQKPSHRQRCFPAGHASGGFGLLGLLFLMRTRRARVVTAVGVMALGWSMGLYKMAIGDHFFSHTFISMTIGWLVTGLVGLWLKRSDREDIMELK